VDDARERRRWDADQEALMNFLRAEIMTLG